jgi:hypothetical protein
MVGAESVVAVHELFTFSGATINVETLTGTWVLEVITATAVHCEDQKCSSGPPLLRGSVDANGGSEPVENFAFEAAL